MRLLIDWAEWSREAVRLVGDRNAAWQPRFRLIDGRFHWDLERASIAFERDADRVVANLRIVGTTSRAGGTFLWAWANESIPLQARRRLDRVREFGVAHSLDLLTAAEHTGGRPEALEALAIVGRILDAEGVFMDEGPDLGCYFALFDFRVVGKDA